MAGEVVILCCGFFVFVLALLAAFYVFSIYNGLISLRNNIEKAWANIDVLLKQRTDLIPNLVETVKGYMKYEKGTLEEITRLRTSMMSATTPGEKALASEGISAALKTIFAVAENYPKLEASQNFLKLQEQLSAIENQIADRREFYNDSVMLFNTRIHSVPDTIFASMMGLKDKEYFKVAEEDKKIVQVKMDEDTPKASEFEAKAPEPAAKAETKAKPEPKAKSGEAKK
ncbi:LemA family protein [Candidatus Micrarchaeota archaeon]|nr:LemA family protein [Candidatus Micrarchaeota archaeon]